MEIDSFIDSALFRASAWLSETYDDFSAFMLRFGVGGWRRWGIELLSEGATLGAAALVVLLAFARPAFEATRDDDWRNNTELAVTFLDRTGGEMGRRGIRRSDAVPLEEIPEHLVKATLATEDRRFYQHFGIDVPGTLRALATNLRANSVVEGGSSITQQLAKNLFLSNERTLQRKIKEAFLALWLEANFTKDEILKLYLDRAYMGGGAFGVEAAADFYFGKSVRDVTLAEAAMMSGLFKAPARYAPHVNLPAARARASEVLGNLVQAGFMTEGEVAPARRAPAKAIAQQAGDTPDYFLDWTFEELKRVRRGKDNVLVVRTTFDPGLQRQAELAIESSLRQYGEQYDARQAAMVVMEPDGGVRAMVGGRDYSASQFNRAVNALRQPGSSFKPYVYAAALAHGYKPTQVVRDEPFCIGTWCPQNYARKYAGPVTLTTALAKSINTIPVRLGQAVSLTRVQEIARAMGVRSELKITRSMPLGTSEMTVLDQTTGFASFANGGRRVTPYAISEIRNGQGELLYSHERDEPPAAQVLPPHVVTGMNTMLNAVTEVGTGRRSLIPGVKVAGKTGTSQSYRDAWFVGFTGNYVGGIWFGNDDEKPMAEMTGGSIPAQTWQRVMAYAHQGVELKPIPGLPVEVAPPVAVAQPAPAEPGLAEPLAPRPLLLSGRTRDVLGRIEERFRSAAPGDPEPAADIEPAGDGRRASGEGLPRTLR